MSKAIPKKELKRLKKQYQAETAENKAETKEKIVALKQKKPKKFMIWLKKLIKPLKSLCDTFLLIIFSFLPYYFASVYEGYATHLPTKNVDPHILLHRDKTIWFGYMIAAIVTVELMWFMLKRLKHNLDWHLPEKWQLKNMPKLVRTIIPILQIIMDGCLIVLGISLPYFCASSYERTIAYINTKYLDRFLISHLDKAMNFGYMLAAAVTVKLIIILYQRLKHNILKKKG